MSAERGGCRSRKEFPPQRIRWARRSPALSDNCALEVEVGQESLTFGGAYANIWVVILFGVFHCLWAGYVFSFLYYSPSKTRA